MANAGLEQEITGIIGKALEEGMVARVVQERLEACITEAVNDALRSYNGVGKLIREKVTDMLVPAIEGYDFGKYVIKLDDVLTRIVNSTTVVDTKQMLENFQELMTVDEGKKVVTVSELFAEWKKWAADAVDTDGLEVELDDGPTYEAVGVTVSVIEEERPSWSSFRRAVIRFECEHDESLNVEIQLEKWANSKGSNWRIGSYGDVMPNSIRHMNPFELLVTRLARSMCEVALDVTEDDDTIVPTKEPEASFA